MQIGIFGYRFRKMVFQPIFQWRWVPTESLLFKASRNDWSLGNGNENEARDPILIQIYVFCDSLKYGKLSILNF